MFGTERVRGSEGGLAGWGGLGGGEGGNRVVCEFILSPITSIIDEYLLSTLVKVPRMQVAHRGRHILISHWPSTVPSVHLFISSSDGNPPRPFLYSSALSSISQIISPSFRLCIHPAIHLSIRLSPHHSPICLPSIHPSVLTRELASITFQQLHRECNPRSTLAFQTNKKKKEKWRSSFDQYTTLDAISPRLDCSGKCGKQQQGENN